MARKTLVGRTVKYTVTLSVRSPDGSTEIQYQQQEAEIISGPYGKGLWGKQYINILTANGRLLSLPISTITVKPLHKELVSVKKK